jgi:purine-nucleoside phosphorylase
VLGMSLVSNMACGVAGADPNSDEVMDVAKTREADFSRLMETILAAL